MTTTTNGNADLAAYLDAVKARLEDLPDEERQDVIDDLEAHLAEIAAEDDTPLVERLGPPDAYAAELRISAGYDAPAKTTRRFARSTDALKALADHRAVASVRAFLPELRPGWWVGRGAGGVIALLLVSSANLSVGALVLIAAAVAGSVWLGKRSDGAKYRRLAIAANVAVVVLFVLAIGPARDRARPQYIDNYVGPQSNGFVVTPDGRPLFNIYPFAADGTPLESVLLYDQDGMPIDFLSPSAPDGTPFARQYPLDEHGNPISNAYPQHVLIPDESGAYRPDRRPAVSVPRQSATTTTTAPAPTTTIAPG